MNVMKRIESIIRTDLGDVVVVIPLLFLDNQMSMLIKNYVDVLNKFSAMKLRVHIVIDDCDRELLLFTYVTNRLLGQFRKDIWHVIKLSEYITLLKRYMDIKNSIPLGEDYARYRFIDKYLRVLGEIRAEITYLYGVGDSREVEEVFENLMELIKGEHSVDAIEVFRKILGEMGVSHIQIYGISSEIESCIEKPLERMKSLFLKLREKHGYRFFIAMPSILLPIFKHIIPREYIIEL